MRPDFPDQVWERLQTQPPPRQAALGLTGLGWFAAASVALALTLVALNRDLLDLTHDPNSPLVDELVVSDWTALDSPL